MGQHLTAARVERCTVAEPFWFCTTLKGVRAGRSSTSCASFAAAGGADEESSAARA